MSKKEILFIFCCLTFIFVLAFNFKSLTFLYKTEESKYVIYECTFEEECGGLGDRLKGIMSAYALALLTDRHLLIKHVKPCLLTNFLEPNEYNWNNYVDVNIAKTINIWKVNDLNFRNQIEFWTKLDFNAQYVSVRTNLDWILPLSKNKNLHSVIKRLGYEPSKFKIQYVFKKWYRKLFKLNIRLNEKYLSFLDRINNTKLFCAQVRIGGAREFVSHDSIFTFRNNSKLYWNYIRSNFIKNQTNYKIFLTTDTKNVEQEAINEFGQEKLIINEGNNYHLDREYDLESDDMLDKIFLDFHALQNCQMALISESGFGKLKILFLNLFTGFINKVFSRKGKLGVWNRENPNQNLTVFSNKIQGMIKYENFDEVAIDP